MNRNERGQAILEFALILPLFAILLLGGIDLYFAISSASDLAYIAEESARCTGTGNPNCQNLNVYAQRLGLNVGLLNAGTLTATSGPSDMCTTNCTSVTVSYPYVPLFPVPYVPSIQMERTAQFSN